MTYNKPELDIRKFDIVEDIMADGSSALTPTDPAVDTGAKSAGESIGSDLIIG
jgi:hypothetical protein